MPKTYTRADWGARTRRAGPGLLYGAGVKGVALHWPAMSKPLRGRREVEAALRGWQAYHMDERGYSDIAYQEAYDQDGNTYELRGLDVQSGANGDTATNKAYGAVLLILAPGETPTPAMVKAVRRGVRRHRALFSRSRLIVGHNDVRPEPTACPGPIVSAMIDAGDFEPLDLSDLVSLRKALRDARKAANAAGRIKMRKRLESMRKRVSRAIRRRRR